MRMLWLISFISVEKWINKIIRYANYLNIDQFKKPRYLTLLKTNIFNLVFHILVIWGIYRFCLNL